MGSDQHDADDFYLGRTIGHLPIYGAFAALLLWAPGQENMRLWLHGLREGPLEIGAAAQTREAAREETRAAHAAT